jgi:hypothetical protein
MALTIRVMLLAVPLLVGLLFVDSQDLNHPKVCIRLLCHLLDIMKRLFGFRMTRVWSKLMFCSMKESYFCPHLMVFSSRSTKGLAKLCGSFAMVYYKFYTVVCLYFNILPTTFSFLLLDPPVKVPSNIKDALTYVFNHFVLNKTYCHYYF